MNKQPSLEELGLDAPATKPHVATPPPIEKTIDQKPQSATDASNLNSTVKCQNCNQLIHRQSTACAFCKKPITNQLDSKNKPAPTHPKTKVCQFCKSSVDSSATKCPHCQEWLTEPTNWSGVAAILSFFLPGLGQLYKGDIGRGLSLFIFTAIGYALFIVPGLVMHLLVVADAGRRIKWLI